MALKTFTATFNSGTTITRFTTDIQTVLDSLNRDNLFVRTYDYKKIAIDNIYFALGLKTKAGSPAPSSFSTLLDFGNTYVDGYNSYSASELVIDGYRIAGLG